MKYIYPLVLALVASVQALPLPPPTYYIEENFDFVDNDIGNTPAVKAEDCAQICVTTSGCKAFSWNNYNGGTCWLKSGRGTVIIKQGVRSAVVLAGSGPNPCNLYQGIDIVGNDIGTGASTDPKGCCAKCRAYPGCRAFSWNGYLGGTCYFKSAMGKTIVSQYTISAQVFPDSYAPRCALQPGIDFVGNDFANVQNPDPKACCTICSNTAGCRAFSWNKYNGGTCWLKNLELDTIKNDHVTSCQVNDNPEPPKCSLEQGVDYVDNDIGTAPSTHPYGCCSLCLKQQNCKAFSWTNTNGGTCYLKSAKGATVPNPNVYSAVVAS